MPNFKDVLISMSVQMFFLIAGIVLVGFGSNFYLGFGLAALIIYGKSIK